MAKTEEQKTADKAAKAAKAAEAAAKTNVVPAATTAEPAASAAETSTAATPDVTGAAGQGGLPAGVPAPTASATPAASTEPITVKYRDHKGEPTERTFSPEVHGPDFAKLADEFKATNATKIIA
jgi:hypothetical protein